MIFMVRNCICAHIDCHIRHMTVIISEIFFYNITFVPTKYNELIESIMRIDFHYVPENRLSTNLYHWFRFQGGFFGQARA